MLFLRLARKHTAAKSALLLLVSKRERERNVPQDEQGDGCASKLGRSSSVYLSVLVVISSGHTRALARNATHSPQAA